MGILHNMKTRTKIINETKIYNGIKEIKVEYKPAKQEGPQTKTVTITANTENPITKLEIRAKVIKEEVKE